jgi:hypothetical protein
MATTKITSFNVVQEKHDAFIVVRKMIDSLNVLVKVPGKLGVAWLLLSFGSDVENAQNQNGGIGEIDVVFSEAILDGRDIFVCLAKYLGVEDINLSTERTWGR